MEPEQDDTGAFTEGTVTLGTKRKSERSPSNTSAPAKVQKTAPSMLEAKAKVANTIKVRNWAKKVEDERKALEQKIETEKKLIAAAQNHHSGIAYTSYHRPIPFAETESSQPPKGVNSTPLLCNQTLDVSSFAQQPRLTLGAGKSSVEATSSAIVDSMNARSQASDKAVKTTKSDPDEILEMRKKMEALQKEISHKNTLIKLQNTKKANAAPTPPQQLPHRHRPAANDLGRPSVSGAPPVQPSHTLHDMAALTRRNEELTKEHAALKGVHKNVMELAVELRNEVKKMLEGQATLEKEYDQLVADRDAFKRQVTTFLEKTVEANKEVQYRAADVEGIGETSRDRRLETEVEDLPALREANYELLLLGRSVGFSFGDGSTDGESSDEEDS